ncbi:hypothetical protein ACP4OV_019503 [Aristida adscensionis]
MSTTWLGFAAAFPAQQAAQSHSTQRNLPRLPPFANGSEAPLSHCDAGSYLGGLLGDHHPRQPPSDGDASPLRGPHGRPYRAPQQGSYGRGDPKPSQVRKDSQGSTLQTSRSIPSLKVWFQRPKDIVRKLLSGGLDLGIVGLDIVNEYGKILLVPKEGMFENINSVEDLARMPEWTEERPLRIVTGFGNLGDKFLKEKGFKNVLFLSADGALESFPLRWKPPVQRAYDFGSPTRSYEQSSIVILHLIDTLSRFLSHLILLEINSVAIPLAACVAVRHCNGGLQGSEFYLHGESKTEAVDIMVTNGESKTEDVDIIGLLRHPCIMGMADAILDLVSTGTTLRDNNLKEITGGEVLESQSMQAIFVASRRSLHHREGTLEIARELLERLEAHLRASAMLMVTANMQGKSAEEVTESVMSLTSLCTLQGPTISPIYNTCDGEVNIGYYAINVAIPKKLLYDSIQQLRYIGGSRVSVSKLIYVFEEETPRWRNFLSELGF